jgi:hypothetical protein
MALRKIGRVDVRFVRQDAKQVVQVSAEEIRAYIAKLDKSLRSLKRPILPKEQALEQARKTVREQKVHAMVAEWKLSGVLPSNQVRKEA